jgi:hypothetical protein
MEICTFSLVIMFVKIVLFIIFLVPFLKLFQYVWNQHEILGFLLPFWIFVQKICFMSYNHFLNFAAKPQKPAQKIKNVFSKCVLDIDCSPIIFVFFKKSNSLYPNMQCYMAK